MLIRNATLPDGRTGIDLLVQQGRIAALGAGLFHGQPAPAGSDDIDAAGWLLSPPFVVVLQWHEKQLSRRNGTTSRSKSTGVLRSSGAILIGAASTVENDKTIAGKKDFMRSDKKVREENAVACLG